MQFPWVFLFALLAGSATCRPNRIVGGSDATVEEFPSIVQIEMFWLIAPGWAQGCGGNILNSRYILSAAHCFFISPDFYRIRAGATYRHTGGVVSYVHSFENHPDYGSNGFEADLSMVRLSTPLVYSPVIQQARIPPPDTVIPHNLPVTHAGWGSTKEGGPASDVLQSVGIYTVDNAKCSALYATLPDSAAVTENMVCAGLLNVGGADACQGDSGGPMYYKNPDQTLVTLAVVSWGEGCANKTFPGVSIAIPPYFYWIVSLI